MSMQYLIGVFYQIRDDYINICSEKYAKEKCFFEDITEGKVWMETGCHSVLLSHHSMHP